MKIAAYQTSLCRYSVHDAIALVNEQVRRCETQGVEILCCPEAILGGLADYAPRPAAFAINVGDGGLDRALAPLASASVTTIVGFTEVASGDRLYNSAAIFRNGAVAGVYRKLHPAINTSVYEAGDQVPVFTVGELTFGILLCNDSNFVEPARIMAAKGATALFVPTNNGMPENRSRPEFVADAQHVDVVRAKENGVYVIRADVSGKTDGLLSYGASSIVDPEGKVLQCAGVLSEALLIADIATTRPGLVTEAV